jgi:ATP-dependent Clp protease ATP-binding subunit ClpB
MKFDFLSPAGRRAMVAAQRLAAARDQPEVEPAHVLLALVDVPEAVALVRAAGGDPAALRPRLEDVVAKLPRVPGDSVYLGAAVLRLLDMAQVEARERGGGLVAPEHLLLAVPLDTRGAAATALRASGVTLPRLDEAWKKRPGSIRSWAATRRSAG